MFTQQELAKEISSVFNEELKIEWAPSDLYRHKGLVVFLKKKRDFPLQKLIQVEKKFQEKVQFEVLNSELWVFLLKEGVSPLVKEEEPEEPTLPKEELSSSSNLILFVFLMGSVWSLLFVFLFMEGTCKESQSAGGGYCKYFHTFKSF